jgi:tRNA A37 threonylcarbamoyladenosine modification protein TsaB
LGDHANRLTVAIDAYRQQAYVSQIDRDQGLIGQVTAMPLSELTSKVSDIESDHFVTGDAKLFPNSPKFLTRQCDAVGVAVIANQLAAKQQWTDPLAAVPQYLKPSAATEKHDAKSPGDS